MSLLDGLLGPMLVGSWFTTALVVLELIWALRYYRQSAKHDPMFLKALVAIAMVIDLAGLGGAQANVYLFCVLYWGDNDALTQQYWPVPYCFITGVLTVALVQGFFIFCYLRLSKNYIVTAVLSVLALAAMASGLAMAILTVTWHTVEQRLNLGIPIKIWLIIDAGADIFISLALIHAFMSKKTDSKGSETLIQKFVILFLESATIPALCAILALIMFLVETQTNVSAIFLWIHPRAYLLSMLYMLNLRQKLRDDMQTDSDAPTQSYTIGAMRLSVI